MTDDDDVVEFQNPVTITRNNIKSAIRGSEEGAHRHYQTLLPIDEPLDSTVKAGESIMASNGEPSKITPLLIYIIFITTFGPLQFGFHLGELNTIQAVLTCEKPGKPSNSSLPQCIRMNPSQFGLISSIYTLGGLLGALCAGSFTTRYGRLMALRACSSFFILGPVAESLAQTIGLMGFGRFLSGVGAGASIVVVPMYIAEVAPIKQRGLFGASTQVMTNAGIVIALLFGFFLGRDSLWRIVLGAAGVIGLTQLVGLIFIPESPKWLAEHKHPAQARRILQRIRGSTANIEPEVKGWDVNGPSDEEETLLQVPTSHLPPSTPPISFIGAVTNPRYRPAIIAVIAVMFAQQFTGINSIVMYSVSILSSLLPTSAALLTVLVAVLNLIVTIACAPLADKLGRKTCLLTSIAGMGAAAFVLAFGIMKEVKILSAIAVLIFVGSFGIGLGPVPFILASEFVGQEAVGATQSWALGANWIATFIVAQFFPVLNVAMGGHGRVYFVFTAMAVLLGGFIWYWVPETLGKEGMDEVWGYDMNDERRAD